MPVLLSEVRAGALHLTLNRPASRNALSRELRADLLAALLEAAADPSLRAVVIRGAGGAFCSGADLTDLGDDAGPAEIAAMLENGRQVIAAVVDCPKPVVAALQGAAAGAGLSLALACDLLVADDTAVLHPVFRRVGLAPDWGLTHWFVRSLGVHRAKDVLLTGRSLPAAEGMALGLVSRVWPAATFEAELDAFVTDLATGPTAALSLTKSLVDGAADLAATMEAETDAALLLTRTADHAEAVQAFAERRPPRFAGH